MPAVEFARAFERGGPHARTACQADPMPAEIERRYLVDDATTAEDRAERSEVIRQGYVAIDPDGTQVRVRKLGDETLLTVKRGAGRERFEAELQIGESDFDDLWPLTEGRRIEKRRHYGDAGAGAEFEADVFAGPLAGLVVVEVEFDSAGDSERFQPPGWFGREVTEDERYSNVNLAVEGRPEEGS
jgi:adenylate cyclase